jgi:hypothetical protein
MEPLPLALVGWIFTLLSAAALIVGAILIMAMHRAGELHRRLLVKTAWNDMLLFAIWVLGLAGGVGVIGLRPWGRDVLEFFCWTLLVLLLLSAATRLYAAKAQSPEARESWVAAIAGVTLVLIPILVLCGATIYTLRSEVARQAFGG